MSIELLPDGTATLLISHTWINRRAPQVEIDQVTAGMDDVYKSLSREFPWFPPVNSVTERRTGKNR